MHIAPTPPKPNLCGGGILILPEGTQISSPDRVSAFNIPFVTA